MKYPINEREKDQDILEDSNDKGRDRCLLVAFNSRRHSTEEEGKEYRRDNGKEGENGHFTSRPWSFSKNHPFLRRLPRRPVSTV